MIHTIRTVAVGDQESKIDSPIILYRGDREVEVEFTINGSKFTFTNGGNVIKSTNATHGQLVINTPTGENMFSEVTECNNGKVVFVITKEMIDELIEVGFYSFQIRLFDESQVSRVTIPPVLKGIDIRNPIAAEDETNVVDIALVDYAVVVKDEFEDLSTFLPDGNYNKTEWESKDAISGAKLNKIEDALYNINSNMEATDLALLNRVENINKTIHGEIDKLGNELESEVEEFERELNNNVERFKVDTNTAMTTHKNEVSEVIDSFDARLADIAEHIDIYYVEKFGVIPNTSEDMSLKIQQIIDNAKPNSIIKFKKGKYKINPTQPIYSGSQKSLCGVFINNKHNLKIDIEEGCEFYMDLQPNTNSLGTQNWQMMTLSNCNNITISGGIFTGDSMLRYADTSTTYTGEWSYGIAISENCKNINLLNMEIRHFFGDCINVGMLKYNDEYTEPQNIVIKNCYLHGAWRHNLTIDCVDRLKLLNNKLVKETLYNVSYKGYNIDFEQVNANQKIHNVHLENNYFENGDCAGVYYGGKNFTIINNEFNKSSLWADSIENNIIKDNYFYNRQVSDLTGVICVRGDSNSINSKNVLITGNIIKDTNIGITSTYTEDLTIQNNILKSSYDLCYFPGIYIKEVNKSTIQNNRIINYGNSKGNASNFGAVAIEPNCPYTIVDSNYIENSKSHGIQISSHQVKCINNTIINSSSYGILIIPKSPLFIKGNYLKDNKGEWQIFSYPNAYGGIISDNIIRCENPNTTNNYPPGCIFTYHTTTVAPIVANNDCKNGSTSRTFGDSVLYNGGNILVDGRYSNTLK